MVGVTVQWLRRVIPNHMVTTVEVMTMSVEMVIELPDQGAAVTVKRALESYQARLLEGLEAELRELRHARFQLQ